MSGLLIKDLYELKKLWLQPKFLLSSTIIVIAGIFFLNSSALIVSIFVSVFFINTIQSLFVSDKKSGWILFIKTTPISSVKIVSARYILSTIICLVTTLVNAGISLILWLLFKHLSFKEYVILILIFLIVTLIYTFIMLPFFYSFDENGLTIGILLCALIAFLASKIPNFSIDIITYLHSLTSGQITIIGLIILITLGILSFFCSIFIFNRKG